MNISHLLSDLQKQKLSFISPRLWNDPFEQLFYQEDGVYISEVRYYIRCICFSYDWIDSEEASWNRSCDTQEIVRVEYDYENLCKLLSNNKNLTFYFSLMDYSLSRKNISQLSNLFKNNRWSPSSLSEYLNVLSLKRKAFCYENEIRLFMVSEEPFSDDIVRIDSSSLKIKSVCFPPKKQTIISELNKKLKENGIRCLQSRLYDLE